MKAEALADCNAALEMDNNCIAAYALRSKLSPGIIDEVEQDDCKEKEEEERKCSLEEDALVEERAAAGGISLAS